MLEGSNYRGSLLQHIQQKILNGTDERQKFLSIGFYFHVVICEGDSRFIDFEIRTAFRDNFLNLIKERVAGVNLNDLWLAPSRNCSKLLGACDIWRVSASRYTTKIGRLIIRTGPKPSIYNPNRPTVNNVGYGIPRYSHIDTGFASYIDNSWHNGMQGQ
jgi:hypothetical protein